MKTDTLIDRFVEHVNTSGQESLPAEEVPEFLRTSGSDEDDCGWQIRSADFEKAVTDLEGRIGLKFPPSYKSLISRYAFPAFECGGIMLFSHTGTQCPLELAGRLFKDETMSPFLVRHGFLQFGRLDPSNYDPVCFDTSKGKHEHPIVQLDHEEVLVNNRVRIVEVISPSFVDFVKRVLDGMAS